MAYVIAFSWLQKCVCSNIDSPQRKKDWINRESWIIGNCDFPLPPSARDLLVSDYGWINMPLPPTVIILETIIIQKQTNFVEQKALLHFVERTFMWTLIGFGLNIFLLIFKYITVPPHQKRMLISNLLQSSYLLCCYIWLSVLFSCPSTYPPSLVSYEPSFRY